MSLQADQETFDRLFYAGQMLQIRTDSLEVGRTIRLDWLNPNFENSTQWSKGHTFNQAFANLLEVETYDLLDANSPQPDQVYRHLQAVDTVSFVIYRNDYGHYVVTKRPSSGTHPHNLPALFTTPDFRQALIWIGNG